jgi:hypothetical protein
VIHLVAGILLGAVLAASALLKLRSPESSRAGLATFGIEGPRATTVVWAALIAIELVLAATVAAGSDLAAWCAAALMLMFAATMVSALARGKAGRPCACFGAGSTVGPASILRNLVLAAGFAALPFVPETDPTTDGWLAIGLGVALLACAALAVAVLGLAREVGMLRLQLGTQGALEIAGEGPDIGSDEPELIARLSPNGAPTGVAIFTSEGCHLCQTLEPAIENLALDPRLAVGVFDEVADGELWRSLEIPGSPFAVALDRGGTVLAKGTFNNLAQLESVVATAEHRRANA